MLTSKQRAYLRGQANNLNAIFQIGKSGITPEIITELDVVLEKRELIKITVLETAFMTAREACEKVCDALGADGVSCVGSKMVIYRPSKDKSKEDRIVLPR